MPTSVRALVWASVSVWAAERPVASAWPRVSGSAKASAWLWGWVMASAPVWVLASVQVSDWATARALARVSDWASVRALAQVSGWASESEVVSETASEAVWARVSGSGPQSEPAWVSEPA